MLFFKIIFKELYHLIKSRESREFLRLALFCGSRKRYKACKFRFLKYRFEVPDALSFIWQFKEIFADESYRFLSDRENPLIYDCGANVGTSCLYFKKLYPKAQIKAFEADPQIAEILKKNLETNRIQGIEIFDKAVWIDDKGIEISQEGADGASVFGKGNKILIPSLRLKDWIEKEEKIDMLKMDIEGAEVAVLKDCKEVLHRAKHIFVEYHAYTHQTQELDEILAILQYNNFRYFIKNEVNRRQPFIHKTYKNNSTMDLQLNIFAYKVDSLMVDYPLHN